VPSIHSFGCGYFWFVLFRLNLFLEDLPNLLNYDRVHRGIVQLAFPQGSSLPVGQSVLLADFLTQNIVADGLETDLFLGLQLLELFPDVDNLALRPSQIEKRCHCPNIIINGVANYGLLVACDELFENASNFWIFGIQGIQHVYVIARAKLYQG
jgi:hypothetical protein